MKIESTSSVPYGTNIGASTRRHACLCVSHADRCSHVPNKGEQMVRYYGFYSSVSRGKRKKSDQDDLIPSILEPVEDPDFSGEGSSKEHRKNWARLIQKIYETDPLCCPKCSGKMRILSFIEDPDVIKKILKHLGLWDIKARAPPKRANAPPPDIHAEYSHSQVPLCEDHLYYDPDYPIETYASRRSRFWRG